MHDNAVLEFAVGHVISMCRAKNNDVLMDDAQTINKFSRDIKNTNEKYDKFIGVVDETNLHRKNCGALTTNVCIAPSGEIKFCLMDDMSNF